LAAASKNQASNGAISQSATDREKETSGVMGPKDGDEGTPTNNVVSSVL